MKYEWKQTIFRPEDFDGAGQYIIRETISKKNSPHITDSVHLSTIMMKVGWSLGTRKYSGEINVYCLVDMSNGMIKEGYFTNTTNEKGETISIDEWIWNAFTGTTNYEAKARLCEYLNNNPHKETFRFATTEEVVRVVMNQKHRTRG